MWPLVVLPPEWLSQMQNHPPQGLVLLLRVPLPGPQTQTRL